MSVVWCMGSIRVCGCAGHCRRGLNLWVEVSFNPSTEADFGFSPHPCVRGRGKEP